MKCLAQSRSFIYTGREHHDGALIKDHLHFETEVADRLEHERFVRLPGGDDHVPNRYRVNPPFLEFSNELWGGWVSEVLHFMSRGPVEQCAVFRHHSFAEVTTIEILFEIIQLATGDHDQLATGTQNTFE